MQTRTALHLLAFDLGAESGRAMVGHFDGERLGLEELHRFSNGPVFAGEHLYSDVLRIWAEMQTGLQKAAAQSETGLASVGVDTWGVDFALLDGQDRLLGNPFHYRDPHNRAAPWPRRCSACRGKRFMPRLATNCLKSIACFNYCLCSGQPTPTCRLPMRC